MDALDAMLTKQLLLALAGRRFFSEEELCLLQLPCQLGGIGLPSFQSMAAEQFKVSCDNTCTSGQVEEILHQQDESWQAKSCNFVSEMAQCERASAAVVARKACVSSLAAMRERVSQHLAHGLEELSSKGSSSWLTALPLSKHGFHLSKQDFWDGLKLRYDWPLYDTLRTCTCGVPFTPAHAMCCQRGGFLTICHNEVRDLVGYLLSEVCHSVAIEPQLAPLSGEVFSVASTNTADDARADVRARGFWTRAQDAFFDIRIFHPDAASYVDKPLEKLFLQHEQQKKLEYNERIVNVDRGTFCPLVFTTAGAASPECAKFLQRLCGMLANLDRMPYAQTAWYVRCRLSFALLRAAIMCLRGSRSSYHQPVNALRELAVAEGQG